MLYDRLKLPDYNYRKPLLLQQELPWHLVCSALKEKQQPPLLDLVEELLDTKVEEEEEVVERPLVDKI